MKVLYNDGTVGECSSEEEAHVVRHSAAHIMAQAIKRLYPDARFGYGPATDNGFYYDVDLGGEHLSEDDFPAIEAEMGRIVKENLRFTVFELPRSEAKALMVERGELYKAEHIDDLDPEARITFFSQGEYVDMCIGPHLTYTKALKAFKLTGVSGAYWKNDAENKMLTRINGIAFPTKEELDAHLAFIGEAKKRDHRKIGQEMELFMFADEGPGFPFWLPNGTKLKNALIEYWHEMMADYGYDEVETPQILSRKLWETSGHWDHYKENMYTTLIDDEDFAVKPMNCPGACLIYKSKPRSYRDLPLKLAEAGLDHRHEMRGALHGLFRVRAFTQDDGHIFVTPEQITSIVLETAQLFDAYYRQFGFEYKIELSTRPADSMGSDEDWEHAEAGLEEALGALGVAYILNEGDGAFYGPKIDFHLTDCLGRTWQCGTIQLDFQLPLNFGLEYTASDGEKHRPIMIHRAGFGSFERFIGMLTEQYAGKFPTWLSPCQVKILPVSEKARAYADTVAKTLSAAGIRVKVDERDEKIGYKIREARAIDRVPYMLILGEKEAEAGNISVRDRSNETVQKGLDEFIAELLREIAMREG